MKIKVTTGKVERVKVGKNPSIGDIVKKVDEKAGKSVPMNEIKIDGEYAEFGNTSSKIVEISDEDVLLKIKSLVKKEAGLSTNSFSLELVNKGK